METIILVIGYILAVPPLFQIVPALKKPNQAIYNTLLPWRIALVSEFLGALLITLGWMIRGNQIAWLINGLWLIIFSGLWLFAELKLKQR